MFSSTCRTMACLLVLAACSSATDPVTPLRIADLKNTTWRATLPVWIPDTTTPGVRFACSTTWSLAFDGTIYNSPDTLYAMTPGSAYVQCPGQDSVPWYWRGMGVFVYQIGDTIVLRRVTNIMDFARLGTTGAGMLRGPVDPAFAPRGPLVLTR
jgi:hypothetical protein